MQAPTNLPTQTPAPPPQAQPSPQNTPPKREDRRLLKIIIWLLCTIVIGNFPFLALIIYMYFYGAALTLTGLIVNGGLFAIAIAIAGDTFGQTILLIVNDPVQHVIWKVLIMILTVGITIVAVFLLYSFIQITVCNAFHPLNTSDICPAPVQPDASVVIFSLFIFVSCFVLGLIAKGMEK